jgi:hypothetical protein
VDSADHPPFKTPLVLATGSEQYDRHLILSRKIRSDRSRPSHFGGSVHVRPLNGRSFRIPGMFALPDERATVLKGLFDC